MATEERAAEARQERFAEAVAAYRRAVEAGQNPSPQIWMSCYSDVADELKQFFKNEDRTADPHETNPPVQPAVGEPVSQIQPTDNNQGTPTAQAPFGDYELLEEIGSGGMGVVWKARQVSLNRIVALKMILRQGFSSSEAVRRFRTEAEAVASLDHPNIVPIYEVGELQGQHYFSMKLIDGKSLARYLDDTVGACPLLPASQRTGARLVATVARAVYFAHERGILHRDLKPGNILLDSQGQPHVVDFGLAKRFLTPGMDDFPVAPGSTVGALGADQTRLGTFMGTPGYVAPEQAAGTRYLTTGVDIYGLGAILYHLLTDRQVFQGTTPEDIIEQVRKNDPEPPSRVNVRVDLDLEAICLKCLSKDPSARYSSARALAEDLERWLAGEPVAARPVGTLQRAAKWARRQPVIAGLAAALLVLAVLGTGLVSWKWYEATVEWQRAEGALAEANDQKNRAEDEKSRAQTERERAEIRERDARQAQQQAEIEKNKADKEQQRAATLHYAIQLGLIQRELQEGSYGNYVRAHELLEQCDPDLRSWEHHYLRTLCDVRLRSLQGHTSAVHCVAFSPDGKTLASGSGSSVAKGEVRVGPPGEVKLWDMATGSERATLIGHTKAVHCVAFSPDGKTLASASGSGSGGLLGPGGEVKLWDVATGYERATLMDYSGEVSSLVFSPDSKTLASVCEERFKKKVSVKLWDVSTGQERAAPMSETDDLGSVAFSPDGKTLAYAGYASGGRNPGGVKLWDLATGQVRATLKGSFRVVAFSPDGKTLASDSSGMRSADQPLKTFQFGVILWDVATGTQRAILKGHSHGVGFLTFTADGKTLASGTAATLNRGKGEVKLWDVATGAERASVKGLLNTIGSTALSPDGKTLALCGADKTVRLWTLTAVPDRATALNRTGPGVATAMAFGPDGRTLALGSGHPLGNSLPLGVNECFLWDLATGGQKRATLNEVVHAVAFSPDGKTVALGTGLRKEDRKRSPPGVKLWDVATGTERAILNGRGMIHVRSVAFAANGTILVFGGDDGTGAFNSARSFGIAWRSSIDLWDVATGERRATLRGAGPFVAVSPDGETLAAGSGSTSSLSTIRLWDVATRQERATLQGDPAKLTPLTFSPDGKTLASATADKPGKVRLWDVATGQERTSLTGHADIVHSVAFSPDGKRLVTASADTTLKVWDVTTGLEVFTLSHNAKVTTVAFSRDGKRLASAGSGVTVWDPTLIVAANVKAEEVVAELKERNPGFDGNVTHKVEGWAVSELQFLTDNLADISPLKVLPGLGTLHCNGSAPGKGQLADLSPLNGVTLRGLNCSSTKVSDLAPLRDSKLFWLNCDSTSVTDLSPLKERGLTWLACANTKVADLSPLQSMKLTYLNCSGTPVADLSPLKGMKLTDLNCVNTQVADLSPLKDMRLKGLNCFGTKVSDLSPLKDMKLEWLSCPHTQVSSLSPLKDMKLTQLWCWNTPVADLSPLKDMKLTLLEIQGTKVTDLSPLKGMPLKILHCDFQPERDTAILRSIKTLETINGKPAAVFWKEVDAKTGEAPKATQK